MDAMGPIPAVPGEWGVKSSGDPQEVCVDCHWWTGARHHEYGICRVTTNKCSRLHPCDCKRFEREQDA